MIQIHIKHPHNSFGRVEYGGYYNVYTSMINVLWLQCGILARVGQTQMFPCNSLKNIILAWHDVKKYYIYCYGSVVTQTFVISSDKTTHGCHLCQ